MDPTPNDYADWADTNLPDLYDPGMFDYEEVADDVWEAVDLVAKDTVLTYIEDADEREETADELMEVARSWFRGHHDLLIDTLPIAPAEAMTAMQNKPQTSQHSADWYAQRRNRLTASEFAQILDGRRGALMRSKVEPLAPGAAADRVAAAPVAISQPDGEMVATSWGHRFEPVVRDIFELEIAGVSTVCDTLGRFTHGDVPWLSASPDGVVLSGPLAGRLVEIKSPKTRVPGIFVPDEYYVQMQIQMEVCDCPAVEFVEAQFAQRPAGDEPTDLVEKARWKGRIEVYGHLDDSATWCYRYSRPVEDLEDITADSWSRPVPTDLPMLEASMWWLTGWFPRTVLRNREWWADVGWPAAELFWTQVVSSRETWQPPATTDKIEHDGGWLGIA